MGSLMSGWDSRALDSKSGGYKRNRSLTKDEIDAFWKSKQKTIEEHLKEISSLSQTTLDQEIGSKVEELYGAKIQRSNSLPLQTLKKTDLPNVDKVVNKNGWWTRSNWAFLNEPPVTEAASNSYVSQFHVARSASSKPRGGFGIATN